MENIYHEKEEGGVFYGAFSYLTEGTFTGSFEAKCSHVCINILLQKSRFTDGLAVNMDEEALKQTIDSLHIANHFAISKVTEMENLFLVNWRQGQLEVFGSLLAIYHVLKSENLTLLPLTATLHPVVVAANTSPDKMKGYLYFLDNHWMVLRYLGKQWYKFDPWLNGPQLLTDFYVSLYIKQLLADGKLVFVIDGNFPPTPADIVEPEQEPEIEQSTLYSPGKPSVEMNEQEIQEAHRFLDLVFENEDNDLALALLLSLEDDIRKKKENSSSNQQPTGSLQTPSIQSASTSNQGATSTSTPLVTSIGSTIPKIAAHDDSFPMPCYPRKFFDFDSETVEDKHLPSHCTPEIKRRVGTTVNPLIACSDDEAVFNTSAGSDDFGGPFSIMFNESGEGARCLDAPVSLSSELETICLDCSSQSTGVGAPGTSSSVEVLPPPSAPPPLSTPTPSVVISSTDLSSFKKAVPNEVENAANTKQKEEEQVEEPTCCVCWAQEPTHVVVPCGHFCLCASCSLNILQPQPSQSFCPLCKQHTTNIIKLYK